MDAVRRLDLFRRTVALPAWVTGPAFIAASLGALALLGQAADTAHYGIHSVHFYWIVYLYWIGAVPAIFLAGLLMMPPDPPER
jgi:solute:Na+ symporter, SSS family